MSVREGGRAGVGSEGLDRLVQEGLGGRGAILESDLCLSDEFLHDFFLDAFHEGGSDGVFGKTVGLELGEHVVQGIAVDFGDIDAFAEEIPVLFLHGLLDLSRRKGGRILPVQEIPAAGSSEKEQKDEEELFQERHERILS